MSAWYSEVDCCSTLPGCEAGSCAIGHFTAMVWKGVSEIGCAQNSRRIYICRYRSGDSLSKNTANMRGHYTEMVLPAVKSLETCEAEVGNSGGSPAQTPAPTPAPTQAPTVTGMRPTTKGCACRKEWDYAGQTCTNFCCNPDSDSGGNWCAVADRACQGTWWGYCSAEQTDAPIPTPAVTPLPTPATPLPTPTSTEPASGGMPACTAPAARSRAQCESCIESGQCPDGYFCCPYMKKCVSSSSMSCRYPIASCRPTCHDSKCTSEGCDCSSCAAVGSGKQFSWLAWANLKESNSGSLDGVQVTCS